MSVSCFEITQKFWSHALTLFQLFIQALYLLPTSLPYIGGSSNSLISNHIWNPTTERENSHWRCVLKMAAICNTLFNIIGQKIIQNRREEWWTNSIISKVSHISRFQYIHEWWNTNIRKLNGLSSEKNVKLKEENWKHFLLYALCISLVERTYHTTTRDHHTWMGRINRDPETWRSIRWGVVTGGGHQLDNVYKKVAGGPGIRTPPFL